MKRVLALATALLLVPLLVRLLLAQSPAPPPSQAPPPPPTYTLTDLGPLNITAAPSGATALNLSGRVTGFRTENFPSPVCFASAANRAFLWDQTTNPPYTELGTLSGAASAGYGINSSGQIVGTADICVNNASVQRAFIWQNGVMTALDPSTTSTTYSAAFALNTNGDVAGYVNNLNNSGLGYQPVVWKGGTAAGLTILAPLGCQFAPNCQGKAFAINDSGQAAGWNYGAFVRGYQHAVMWDSNGQPTDLGSFGGFYNDQANAINSKGVVVGYSQLDPTITPSTIHAFLWQNGTLTDLGTIPGIDPIYGNASITDNNSSAWGINSKGDVVGISAASPNAVSVAGNGGRAFLYTNGQMYDLLSRLAPGTNWTRLEAAWAINDNGQIVGVGFDPAQQEHGFLLTPNVTPTTTALATSVNPSVFGQQVSFTATVSPTTSSVLTPTGNVTFSDGPTTLGTVALSSGTAIFSTSSLSVAGHTITASYAGDGNFSASTSATVNQVVSQATTSTTLAASPNPANAGQSLTFTATVTPIAPGAGMPTGTVKFLDGGNTLGTVVVNSAGNATFSSSLLARGSHGITAVYGGDTNFAGSSSSSVNQVISQPATSTALTAFPNPLNVGQTVTFTATVTVTAGGGTPTGTVIFLDGPTTLGTGVLSPLGTTTLSTSSLAAGSHTVTASYGGDATFAGSTSTGVTVMVQGVAQVMVNETVHVTDTASLPDVFDSEKITVTDQVSLQALNTTTISISAPSAIYGAPASATVTVNSPTATVTGNVTLTIDGGSSITMPLTSRFDPLLELPVGSATFNLGAPQTGNHTLAANFAAQGNFLASSAQTTFVVSKATPTINWANPAPITYGTLLSTTQLNASTPTAGNFAYSPGLGAVLNAGNQTLSATFTPLDTANYTTVTATVTLVVNKAPATLTWATPASIFYPTALTGVQLDATASVSGNLVYAPAAGTVLSPGTQTLSVAFTPDSTNYTTATATVSIVVIPPVPVMVNETVHVTDTPSFADVFDPEKITVTDQVSVIPCDFTISASPPMNVPVGGSSSTPITIASTNGCNLQVGLSTSPANSGITVSLPSTATTGGGSTSATLTVSAGPSVTPSYFTVTVTGTGGLTHSASVNVNVTASISGTTGVVQTLLNAGAISSTGIANALTSKLSAAQTAGNAQTSINTVKAFQNQVQAQAGKSIATSFTLSGVTFNPANTLMRDGQGLIDSYRLGLIPDPITGYVVNANALGIAGATVSITDTTGNVVASATTDITGFYFMATTGVLTPGANYTMRVSSLPTGFTTATPPSQAFTWQGVAIAFSNFVLN